jgi:hypothetical protein
VPFPYVDADTFASELPYTASDFPGLASESEWQGLLERALKTESERVASYANQVDTAAEWDPADATVPFVARMAVIRLARDRIAGIKEDGLASESLGSGASYDYRPPEALRKEVKEALDEADYRTADDDFVFIA